MSARRLGVLASLAVLIPCAALAAVAVEPGDLALLRACAARYHGLERYELRGQLTLHVASGAPEQTLVAPFVVAYRKPGRLRDEFRNPSNPMAQYSDGATRTEYLPQLGQYRVHPRPVTDAAVADGSAGGNFAFGTGLVKMFGAIADSVIEVTRMPDERITVDGVARPCVVLDVRYPTPPPSSGRAAEGPRMYWIDREDHRLLQVRSRLTRQGPQGLVQVEQLTEFERVRLGEPVADSVFAFTPPEGARRVKQWEFPNQPKAADLSGQPAKDFALPDLDGKVHKLSEHKGSVVLLDFWATWCGPCRMTMPLVDKLEREYRARGLVVYSINLREDRDKALAYIRKQGYGMTTLLDTTGTTADAYQVNGIPALFVIGKDGRIATQMVGVQQEEDLRDAIEEAGVR